MSSLFKGRRANPHFSTLMKSPTFNGLNFNDSTIQKVEKFQPESFYVTLQSNRIKIFLKLFKF